jgi:hypothetical protein
MARDDTVTDARRTRRSLARWLLACFSTTLVASGGLSLVTGSSASAGVSPGVGSSYAQSLQVTPHEGSLAVGAILGEALAGHTGSYGRAQSQSLDLGAIGTALKGYNCGEPPNPTAAGAVPTPLVAETGQPGAAKGRTESDPSKTYGATEKARATATPYAQADTTYGSLGATVFQVSGTATRAWSGLVDGDRVAGATSDIASLDLAAGQVVLQGLHWAVSYPSTGSKHPTGSFTVGHAVIAGIPVPTNDLSALQSTANKVLDNLGMRLLLPHVGAEQGTEAVSALELKVVPNKNRDAVVDQVLNAAGPLMRTVVGGMENGFGPWEPQQLQQQLCKSNTAFTVTDVTLASISGAGFFNASFGGVNATSSVQKKNPYDLSLPKLASSSTSTFVPGTRGRPGTSATVHPGSLSTPEVTGSDGSSGRTPQVASPVAATSDATAGPLLALGLGGLAAALLLAEGDRRKMLGSRRQSAFED